MFLNIFPSRYTNKDTLNFILTHKLIILRRVLKIIKKMKINVVFSTIFVEKYKLKESVHFNFPITAFGFINDSRNH